MALRIPVRRSQGEADYGSMIMVRKGLALVLVAGTLVLTACNTVSGAGKDVSSAGKAVTKSADKNK